MNPEVNLEDVPVPPPLQEAANPNEAPVPPAKYEFNFDNYLNLWYKFNMLEYFVAYLINKKEWPKDKIEMLVKEAQGAALSQCQIMFPQYCINLHAEKPKEANASEPQETQAAPQ